MDKVVELLEKFASLAGFQVERLWPQLVRVFWLENLLDLLLTPVIVFVLSVAALKFLRKSKEADDLPGDHDAAAMLYWVVSTVLAIVVFGIGFVYIFNIGSMLAAVVYPEASYVQSLLKSSSK